MEKEEIIKRIKEGEKNIDKILSWVTCLPNSTSSRKPTVIKVGDVFMHPIFRHPYVILQKKETEFICVLLTTNANCTEAIEKCKSRFFSESYFTKVIFTVGNPGEHSFMNVFESKGQLKSIHTRLKQIFV
jgi:hypothetical protein